MSASAAFADQFLRGLRIQANVIFALLFKDFRARSGGGIIGTMADPVVKVLIFGTLWIMLGRTNWFGFSPYIVMATSFIPHLLLRRGLAQIPTAVRGNMTLYGYPQIRPIDALIARYLLEMTLTLLGSTFLFAGLYWFGDLTPPIPNPLGAIGVLGLVYLMTFGITLIMATYGTLSPAFDHIAHFITRPLIIVSLVFHLGIDLPPYVRYLASFNPLADISEYFRYYMLGIPKMPEADMQYSSAFGVCILAFGLISYYANRELLLKRS